VIGLSAASLAFVPACSSTPPNDPTITPTGGAPAGGAANSAGAPATAGAATGGGTPGGGAPNGGAPNGGAPNGGAPSGGAGSSGTGGGTFPCPPGVTGHCDSADPTKYPTYDGYTLNLVEDFPAPVDLNDDPVWTWSDGFPNDSQTSFAEANITFANGRMILKAESKCAPMNNEFACYPPRKYYAESYTDEYPRMKGGTGVVSGEFRTKYNNFRYGRYEVKFKAPAPIGNFLSTMFVFRNPTNVAWREIDIELEANHQGAVNGNTVNALMGSKSYPDANSAAWTAPQTGLDITTEHVYAFNWTPTSITWYMDNNPTPIHSYDGNGAAKIPTLSAKIMMNLWVFHDSSNFGNVTKNVFPFTSEYDYFRFYKWNMETTYPVPGHPVGDDYVQSAQNNPKEVNYGM